MELAGVLHLCLDASLQGAPSKENKGDTGVAGTGRKADGAEEVVWEYFWNLSQHERSGEQAKRKWWKLSFTVGLYATPTTLGLYLGGLD